MSDTVQSDLSEFERHVIRHLRKLATHGFGELHIIYAKNKATRCNATYTDDPEGLRQMQKEGSPKISLDRSE